MLTNVAPFIIYLISFPVILASLFNAQIGILFLIGTAPILSLMKKIVQYPEGNNIIDSLIAALLIGTILRRVKERKGIIPKSPMTLAVILFIGGYIVNLIRGFTFMDFSAATNVDRLMAWKNFMLLPVIYFISASNAVTEKSAKRVIFVTAFVLLAMDFNFYSTFRWFRAENYRDSIRISGPLGYLGPNELGVFYSIYTFLLLGISYFMVNKKLKYIILLICACNFYPILFSYSRGAYTCVVAGFLALGILKDKRILILLLVLILSYSLILPKSVVQRIDMTFLDQSKTVEVVREKSAIDVGGVELDTVGRKQLWEKAWTHFNAEPLLGIGFDSFRNVEGMITHSMFFRILAEQGILGMIIFIIFIGAGLWQAYKLYKGSKNELFRGIGFGFLLCQVVHLVGSFSGDQSLYFNFMVIFWLFLGMVTNLNIQEENGGKDLENVDRSFV